VPDRLERLVNLTATLLETRRPLSLDELSERVEPRYPEELGSRRRQFERDKETLRELGIPIRVESVDGFGSEQAYRIHPDDYYLPELELTEAELAALHVAVTAVRLEGDAGREGLAKLGGVSPRFMHIDSEHSRAGLTTELALATAVLAPAGIMVLDDMLHPGYPLLVVAVHEYLERHPEMRVLCIIDRETVVAATKFVLCRAEWQKPYEERLLETYKDNVWPMGADFNPNWCPVFSLDTRLAEIPT